MPSFNATVALLGINSYVSVPGPVLKRLFAAAARDKSPIAVRVVLNDASFRQTLVRYRGDWRLYLNTPMRKAAHKQVGDRLKLTVEYDPEPRTERIPAVLKQALHDDPKAQLSFGQLDASLKKDVLRHLNNLKTKSSLERNVENIISQLRGGAFVTLSVSARTPKPRHKAPARPSK